MYVKVMYVFALVDLSTRKQKKKEGIFRDLRKKVSRYNKDTFPFTEATTSFIVFTDIQNLKNTYFLYLQS